MDGIRKISMEFEKCPLMENIPVEISEESPLTECSPETDIVMGNLYEGLHGADAKHVPFMSVKHTISVECVMQKMQQNWKIHFPKVVLLMVAGSKDLLSDNHNSRTLKALMIRGLISAMSTTEMWLCLDGLNQGFSKEFGTAYELYMSRRKMLIRTMSESQYSFFAETALIGICKQENMSTDEKVRVEYIKEDIEIKKYVNGSLDYFLFVRDKSEENKGINSFILNFLKHLREKVKRENEASESAARKICETPVMAVLFQGDIKQIDLVLGHLKNKFPLLIIEGTGGLAHLLSFAYYQIARRPTGTNEADHTETIVKPQITREINRCYPDLRKFNVTDKVLCAKLVDCVRYSKQEDSEFITVLTLRDLEAENAHLPTFLLKASFSSRTGDQNGDFESMKNDLLLAIDWNSPEVAKKKVFCEDTDNEFHADRELFFKILTKPHREKFVDLFLSEGFVIHKFLNSNTLKSLFKASLNRGFFRTVIWEIILGFGSEMDISRHFINNKLTRLLEKLTSIPNLIDTLTLDRNAFGMYEDHTPEQAEQKALIVLAMWSILSYKINLAKIIWKYSEQPVHLALIYSVILHKLQNYISDLSLKHDMENEAKEFNLMATSIISQCYDCTPRRALDLLFQKDPAWSFKPLLEMAAFAKNRPLIATTCCQRYLDNQFLGKLKIIDLPYGDVTIPVWLKVILATFLIFPMSLWMRFDTPENSSQSSTNEILSSEEPHILNRNYFQNANEESTTKLSFEKSRHGNISFIKKLYYLYTAPISKFWVSQAFYSIYLCFFSLAVLSPSCGNIYLDLIVCIWTAAIIMDSVHQVITLPKRYPSISLKLKHMEIVGMTLFVLCYILNRVLSFQNIFSPYYTKVMLSTALLYFYYRVIFNALPLSPDLGPMLYRIKRMVLVDFFSFMRVTALIIISNGVVNHAILYPDFPLSNELLRRASFDSIIALFKTPAQQLRVPDPTCIQLKRDPNGLTFYGLPKDVCKVGRYDRPDCPNTGVWPYIFALQYFIFLKLVLITLLTAFFSNTHARLDAEGTYIWKYQRHQLVVDFCNRVTFPAPFSPLCYCITLLRNICSLFRKKKNQREQTKKLQHNDFKYWKELTSDYFIKNIEKYDEMNCPKRRMEKVNALKEALSKQKYKMKNWQGHLGELQIRKKNVHKILQSSKIQISLSERLRIKNVIQLYSRISPYPNTSILRFPVSDKHVPWTCKWNSYDPIAYTRSREDFPSNLRSHVDEDIQMKRETEGENFRMPLFQWNVSSISPAGVCLDRKSWLLDRFGKSIIYELDSEDLPMNPFGRTGLRGRGCLPRWGPNHSIFTIITRWQQLESISYRQYLEVVLLENGEEIFLPGGYVTTENMYSTIRPLFSTKDPWLSEVDMVAFFRSMSVDMIERQLSDQRKDTLSYDSNPRSHLEEKEDVENARFTAEKIRKSYLDEAINTDQAWCEAEIWHIHYNDSCQLDRCLEANLLWLLLNEELLKKVPAGQAFLLYSVAKKMKARLEVM